MVAFLYFHFIEFRVWMEIFCRNFRIATPEIKEKDFSLWQIYSVFPLLNESRTAKLTGNKPTDPLLLLFPNHGHRVPVISPAKTSEIQGGESRLLACSSPPMIEMPGYPLFPFWSINVCVSLSFPLSAVPELLTFLVRSCVQSWWCSCYSLFGQESCQRHYAIIVPGVLYLLTQSFSLLPIRASSHFFFEKDWSVNHRKIEGLDSTLRLTEIWLILLSLIYFIFQMLSFFSNCHSFWSFLRFSPISSQSVWPVFFLFLLWFRKQVWGRWKSNFLSSQL